MRKPVTLPLPGRPPLNVAVRDALHAAAFIALFILMLGVRSEVKGLNEAVHANREWREGTTHALARMEGRVEAIERLVVALAAGKEPRGD